LLSLFQKIIDELLMHTNIILIFCGSSMAVMESELLGKGTPLYGRNLNIWKFYNEDKSLMENIREILLTKGKNLYDEL